MITAQEFRRQAHARDIAPELLEKDYVLGWALFGIAQSSVAKDLAFKGGTALSKLYYPGNWRFLRRPRLHGRGLATPLASDHGSAPGSSTESELEV